jgi:hypothetical protein
MIYLDTSALITRYIWEWGSEQIHQVFRDDVMITTSKIAYAEIYAMQPSRAACAKAILPEPDTDSYAGSLSLNGLPI